MNHLDTGWPESKSNDRLRLFLILGIVILVMAALTAWFVGLDGVFRMLGLVDDTYVASITINVVPDDAHLKVDFQETSFPTTLEVQWNRGTKHVFDVQHPAYLPEKLIVHIPQDPDLQVTFSEKSENIKAEVTETGLEITIEMRPEYITRKIESSPSKVNVEINGVNTQKMTPFVFEFKSGDQVTLTARKKGYHDLEKIISIEDTQDTSPILLDLKKIKKPRKPKGKLTVNSPYPVEVYAGSKRVINKKKSASVFLDPKKYTIRVLNEQYMLDEKQTVTLRDGKTHRISIELPGTVGITSAPTGAYVYFEETLVGQTPGVFNIAPGLYNVQLQWDQCDGTVSRWIKVVSGQTRNIPMIKGCQ